MKYIGVYYCKYHRKWKATAHVGGPCYFLGYYSDAYGAALAYDSFIKASGSMRRRKLNNLPERRQTPQPVTIERRAAKPE